MNFSPQHSKTSGGKRISNLCETKNGKRRRFKCKTRRGRGGEKGQKRSVIVGHYLKRIEKKISSRPDGKLQEYITKKNIAVEKKKGRAKTKRNRR